MLTEVPKSTPPESLSEDSFLNGSIIIRQPVNGYRAGIDPVMLAASVNARPGDRVLEAGAGHGTAGICLARRAPNCSVTGIEIQPDMVRLANDNARLNGLTDNVQVMIGDLERPLPRVAAGSFDHAIANPPFLRNDDANSSPDLGRATANSEGEAGLSDWIGFLLRMVRAEGTITLIHRADRLDEILSLMQGKAGEITVFPLWPKRGVAAKRVIIRARKDIRTPLVMLPGLVLHEEDGNYTEQADAILRGGACPLK